MNRADLSESFNKAAQTLEESTDSARKMLESLQQDGKLLIAPRKGIMQVQHIKEKVFTPVNLYITFETEEECQVFIEMLKLNVTIPGMIYRTNRDDRFILLQKMMDDLYDAFRNPPEQPTSASKHSGDTHVARAPSRAL